MQYFRSIIIFTFFIIIPITFLSAQKLYPVEDFSLPLKGNLSISGDFGEIRSNHFHMGIDLRLRTGRRIYAVGDGFISRCKIEAGGYGKAVYIDHPGGYRSVYAHLDRFTPELEQFMKEKQKENGLFTTLIYPDSSRFPVKKGQIIGYGGNTGYSFGSHLHFEMRHSKDDTAINPYHFFNFDKDNRPPQVYSLKLTPADEQSSTQGENKSTVFSLGPKSNYYQPAKSIKTSGKIGSAVRAVDRKPAQRNRYSIYRMELYADGKLLSSFRKNEISYSETRYINSFKDFALYTNRRHRYTKLYREKGNKLSIYDNLIDDGYIQMAAGEKKNITINIYDFAGNKSSVKFTLIGESYNALPSSDCTRQIKAEEKNYVIKENFRMISGKNSFYTDFCFTHQSESSYGRMLSEWHRVHRKDRPVHDNVYISIKAKPIGSEYQDKLCLIRRGKNGKPVYAGGQYIKGFVSGEIKRFGTYAVYPDTVPPEIKARNFSEGESIEHLSVLEFDAYDNLSGINEYRAFINGEKAILYYNLKNDRIFCEIPEKLPSGEKVSLIIQLFDKKGNKTVYNTNFFK